MSDGIAATVVAWLLTYTIHSTALLGLAWLATRSRRVHPSASDLIWKAALLGAVVTASVQATVGLQPVGTVSLVRASAAGATPTDRRAATAGAQHTPRLENPTASDAALSAGNGAPNSSPAVTGSAPGPVVTPALLLLLWSVVALVLAMSYVARRLILVGRLGEREAIDHGELRTSLDALSAEIGMKRRVRLTTARSISSPVALGRAEICVPGAALIDLDRDEQRSMLAHELAHLARRDPAWLAISALMERVFFFQPLNRLARRELQTAAEYLCDEWAAERTGSPLALAKCLAKVAEWIEAAPLGVPVAGMAEERSLLVSRISRLPEANPARRARSRSGLALGALVVLGATVVAAPGVSARVRELVQSNSVGTVADSAAQREKLSDGGDCCGRSAKAPVPAKDYVPVKTADGAQMNGDANASLPPDTNVVNALIKSLKDEDAQVRAAAAHSLGRLEDPRAVPPLIESLKDTDTKVRAAAADALGSFEDTRAINPLAALLADADAEVKQQALSALSNFEKGVPAGPVLRLLDDPNADVRHEAAHLLAHIGDRAAVPALLKLIHDPSTDVRQAAIETLGELGDESAASALLQALTDANPDTRHAAISALENLKAPIPEASLLALLKDTNADVRQQAASLAGDRSIVAAVPSLRRLLEDPDGDVRETAVDALSNIVDPAARDALRTALNSSDAKVRRRAAEALGRRQ